MQFRKISDTQPVAQFIASQLSYHLKLSEKVLWLVPGGSSIQIAVETAKILEGTDLKYLTVTLTDERFGTVGHENSNWYQLQQAGFVLPSATLIPVLEGQDRTKTTQAYADNLRAALAGNDYRLGFFGIGADGHTAGILPGSPAVFANEYAASYDAGNFERITMTENAIKQLDEVIVYATGESKWPVLDSLQDENKHIPEQPAQLLKLVPKLTIFNDYKGDSI